MSLDMTAMDAALKQQYTEKTVEDLVFRDNPFLALVPKFEKLGGRDHPIVLQYGHGAGRSATFSVAQANEGNAVALKDFRLTAVDNYALATVDGHTIDASQGDASAFLEAMTIAMDGAIAELTRDLARDLYRDGYGSVGKIAAGGISSATITLDTIDDVVNFENGDVCVFALSNASDTLRNSGAGLTVSAVDYNAGTVTFSAAVSTETGTANGDFIFKKGDRQNSATPSRLKLAGLAAWCPPSAPTSSTFFNVDRTANSRLAGLRYAPTSGGLDEILLDAATRVARMGGKLTHFFMTPTKLNELIKLLSKQVQYIDVKVGDVGFTGVRIMGPKGPIDCIGDINCPALSVWGVDISSWALCSMGKAVKVFNLDDNTWMRQGTADGVEIRYVFRGNLGCHRPCHNINVTLPA